MCGIILAHTNENDSHLYAHTLILRILQPVRIAPYLQNLSFHYVPLLFADRMLGLS